MKDYRSIVILAAFAVVACERRVQPAIESAPFKVTIRSDGRIFSDGVRVTLAELALRFESEGPKKGVVWLYADLPDPLGGVALEVLRSARAKNLRIEMFSSEDFSERMKFSK